MRINLAFYDLTDGPKIATASHVEKVYRFSQRCSKASHSDPTRASLLVRCFARISRSSAIAMIPLLTCYRSEKAAEKRLHDINRCAAPNTHAARLAPSVSRRTPSLLARFCLRSILDRGRSVSPRQVFSPAILTGHLLRISRVRRQERSTQLVETGKDQPSQTCLDH